MDKASLIFLLLFFVVCDARHPDPVIVGVVGGHSVEEADTYVVALRRRGSQLAFCSGSMIEKSWIVTAAHCVKAGRVFEIVSGTTDLRTASTRQGTVSQVDHCVVHPDHDSYRHYNDVAVCKTKTPMTGRPIALASQGQRFVGYDATIAGFGTIDTRGRLVTPNLMQATVEIQEDRVCWRDYPIFDSRYNICAGDMRGGIGVCSGDSGGPLVVSQMTWFFGHRDLLVGVTSYGPTRCAQPDLPAVFTSIASVRQWVRQVSGV